MNTAIISISKQGNQLASRLAKQLEQTSCYTLAKWEQEEFLPIEGKLGDFCETLFKKYEALVFIMASGIVVRSIAPWIKSKTSDPAVVVIDDRGQHVISLLSGHLGGANALTLKIAAAINAHPVITTASDVNHLPSVDMLAKQHGLIIDSMKNATTITAMIVNGENVVLDDPYHILPKDILPIKQGEESGSVIVSNHLLINTNKPFVKLIPQNIVLGIGCKKDTGSISLWEFIIENLKELNIDLQSIKAIASIDVKSDEKAILDAALRLECNTTFYSAEQLQEVDHLFEGSDFVKSTVGVGSVSTTAAYTAGHKNGRFLLKKKKKDGMTLSVFEQSFKKS
ncbi:cobalt-precorrin 5A hydrolase [Plebeiibacterium sediminum]|uniref:Cobalt-precorrin 5A hydrolase n=1 Tax=Plebeiibacterium sediminum TaxID=2992112 RepID=A0AAE3M5R1_9BACT|nr:cobalt-precorrin 5A hydrolase [Plebeiobacterium sediminum]MCW3787135.1 cobalt-precorrin 5A hydrolase [Plebeiobacterium sediminum]